MIRVGDRITLFDRLSSAAAIIGSKEVEKEYGEILKELVDEKFHPAFIRFDALSDKEGGTFPAILKDLTATQKIANILVFDPEGGLGLQLAGCKPRGDSHECYLCEDSTIYYCRRLEEVKDLLG